MIEPKKPQNRSPAFGTLRSGKRIFTETSEKYERSGEKEKPV
jgi:hypothetical protein